MYHNLRETYRESVFQILKICKAFSNFDFNSTIKEKLHWIVELFGNKVIERFSFKLNIQINSSMYSFSI